MDLPGDNSGRPLVGPCTYIQYKDSFRWQWLDTERRWKC